MRIVLSCPSSQASPWMELFAAALPDAKLARHEPDRSHNNAERAEYVIAAYRSSTLFAEQPQPKAVFTVSAGVSHVLRDVPQGVPLIRVEDAGMAEQMVRYAIAATMRAALRFDEYARQQRARKWLQHEPRAPQHIVVGVMGLGVIGSAIARALVDEGFAVRGFANSTKTLPGVASFAGGAGWSSYLDGLDVLINVLPATAATRNLLDRQALSRLRDGAHVVNIGRGDVLVEGDLIALLDSGKLGGATLDVFRDEPLPPDHPFWSQPEITITPHVSGLTIPGETVAQIVTKIRALERGESVSGVVDPERGY